MHVKIVRCRYRTLMLFGIITVYKLCHMPELTLEIKKQIMWNQVLFLFLELLVINLCELTYQNCTHMPELNLELRNKKGRKKSL